jgi:hypothetical protein
LGHFAGRIQPTLDQLIFAQRRQLVELLIRIKDDYEELLLLASR